jgi:DNA-binding transcriptional LysR family regulator
MELRRLSHFLHLAETQRFAAAAERAHLSQAAFSRSIQTLEDRLGIRLFDRSAQGATLTPAGEMLLPRARKLVADSKGLALDMAMFIAGDAGELAIGAAPVPAATIVPELLCRLNAERPQLTTRVRFGHLPALLMQLEANELDLCFGDPRLLAETRERYHIQPIGRQAGRLCCRQGHPLCKASAISPQDIEHYGLAMISLSADLLSFLAKALGFNHTEQLPIRVECDDFTTLARLIARSNVLGFMPAPLIDEAHFSLHSLPDIAGSELFVDVHAIWLKKRTLSPSAQRAVELATALSE